MYISKVSNINLIKPLNVSPLKKVEPLGYKINVKATSPKHFYFIGEKKEETPSFFSMLKDSIISTNSKLVKSENLQQKLVYDPDSVSIHEVTIAAKEAEITLNLTKTIINKLIAGYKDLINIR